MHLLALGMVMKRDTQESLALICTSFAARAAAKMVRQPAVLFIDGLIKYVFDEGGMDYLYEALHGTAIRCAAEKRNLAESIPTTSLADIPAVSNTSPTRSASSSAFRACVAASSLSEHGLTRSRSMSNVAEPPPMYPGIPPSVTVLHPES
jgi:hypothetical protein